MKIIGKDEVLKEKTVADVPNGMPFKMSDKRPWDHVLRMRLAGTTLSTTGGYVYAIRLDTGEVSSVQTSTPVTLYPDACVYEVEPKPNG